MPYTERDDPRRTKLRMDRVDPIDANSNIERDEPKRDTP